MASEISFDICSRLTYVVILVNAFALSSAECRIAGSVKIRYCHQRMTISSDMEWHVVTCSNGIWGAQVNMRYCIRHATERFQWTRLDSQIKARNIFFWLRNYSTNSEKYRQEHKQFGKTRLRSKTLHRSQNRRHGLDVMAEQGLGRKR
jgi:hypothetical protein